MIDPKATKRRITVYTIQDLAWMAVLLSLSFAGFTMLGYDPPLWTIYGGLGVLVIWGWVCYRKNCRLVHGVNGEHLDTHPF